MSINDRPVWMESRLSLYDFIRSPVMRDPAAAKGLLAAATEDDIAWSAFGHGAFTPEVGAATCERFASELHRFPPALLERIFAQIPPQVARRVLTDDPGSDVCNAAVQAVAPAGQPHALTSDEACDVIVSSRYSELVLIHLMRLGYRVPLSKMSIPDWVDVRPIRRAVPLAVLNCDAAEGQRPLEKRRYDYLSDADLELLNFGLTRPHMLRRYLDADAPFRNVLRALSVFVIDDEELWHDAFEKAAKKELVFLRRSDPSLGSLVPLVTHPYAGEFLAQDRFQVVCESADRDWDPRLRRLVPFFGPNPPGILDEEQVIVAAGFIFSRDRFPWSYQELLTRWPEDVPYPRAARHVRIRLSPYEPARDTLVSYALERLGSDPAVWERLATILVSRPEVPTVDVVDAMRVS